MRRLALIGGWLVVVLLTTALTWQIVSAADDRVSQRPSSPLNVAAPILAAGDESSTTPQTTSRATSPTTSPSPNTTSSGATTTTSASIPVPATTTTSPTSEWAVKTISTSGGIVVVKYRPEEVVLQAASPAVGFRAEVEKAGPPEVRVEFENETSSVEVRVEWEDGELEIEISEDD